MTTKVDLYRDRFGVPHVFADSLEDGYYGLGYCAAQDRPRTLLLHQALLGGRLAALIGDRPLPDAELPLLDGLCHTPFFRGYGDGAWSFASIAAVDRWMRLWDYGGIAERALGRMSARSAAILAAFCAGVNAYFERHGAPDGLEPYVPATEIAWWSFFEHTIAMGFFISNAFVLTHDRTEDGTLLLGGDPHYWFLDGHTEAHLVTPELELNGIWDGHVNLAMWNGSNTHIAVGVTAAGLEGAAVYRERLDPEDRERYWDARAGAFRAVERADHLIELGDGRSSRFVARRTHHGPIVSEGLMDGDPVAYAVRSAFHERPGESLDQHLEMWTKRSTREFVAFLRDEAEFVRGHRVVGDRAGAIALVCNGPVAVRDDRFDWGRPVDGADPATEWVATARWRPGAAEYGLPLIADPESGFIQSANDPPWVSTVPMPAHREYPRYVFPDGWRELGLRGARQRELLAGSIRVTRAEAEGLLRDTFVPHAFHGVRALRTALERQGSQAPQLSARAAALDAVLEAWDGRAEVESAGMTAAFQLNRALPGGLPAVGVRANETPHEVSELRLPVCGPAEAADYARALEAVAGDLEERFGRLDVPWGECHVIERPDGVRPIAGACNELRALCGTWRGWWDVGDEVGDDGVERCNFGSRTLRLTELGAEGIVRVDSVVVTGQGPAVEHPGSPHHVDQLELFNAGRFKRLPLSRDDVEREARAADHAACNHASHEALVRAAAVAAPG